MRRISIPADTDSMLPQAVILRFRPAIHLLDTRDTVPDIQIPARLARQAGQSGKVGMDHAAIATRRHARASVRQGMPTCLDFS